ncbi:MAG TPA: sulfotransferase [Vicinamibacterales bacterium]|nr:sulfotransferase [Vicinamibacterales bacterium]
MSPGTAAAAVPARLTPPPALPPRVPFVYILGAGHSGSTLLTLLLGSHPRICTIGEVKAPAIGAPDEYPCSCGERIAACRFWRELSREVAARGARLDIAGGATDIRRAPTAYLRRLLRPLHRGPAVEAIRDAALRLSPEWRGFLDRFQTLHAAVVTAACTITGKDVFVDSSKTGVQLKYLLANPRLDVKVIRLVRDGRGVSLSYRASEGFTFEAGARAWRRANEEADSVVAALPRERWYDLRYETLCREPEATLAALAAFIGVEPLDLRAYSAGPIQHVLGNNKARLRADEIRLDERWRRTLTPEDLHLFDRVAGDVNRRYGYDG